MLVISCPHALGLAIPLTTSLSSAFAARNGILVKDRLALATADAGTQLSKAAYRKRLENLWWATGYNILAIPIAAGALACEGISMPPAVATILVNVSTIVAANAQLLRRIDRRPLISRSAVTADDPQLCGVRRRREPARPQPRDRATG